MPAILDQIVDSKLRQLELQKHSMPLESIQNNLQPSDRDFAAAIKQDPPAFILECKKASPSKGLLRSDFDLAGIAETYAKYASAISVLTETEHFQGSLANLGIVRQHAPQPILCKDFLVDPYQVYQARHFGADAILLILAILDNDSWSRLFEIARSLNMDVVTEISNEEEQERAKRLQAPIVGINNRDLRDMSIDLETTRRLAPGFGNEVVLISESGFYFNHQIRAIRPLVDAFLVGSSLMAERDLSTAVRRLIYGENKVCGLTRNRDAREADRAGAAYGGVIFAESSPRRVQIEDVDAVFQGTGLQRVGVFQDQSIETILETCRSAALHVIQLHGNEDPAEARRLREILPPTVKIWKAISVDQLNQGVDIWFQAGVDRLIVDNQRGHQRGGTGQSFDWSRLNGQRKDALIVAGGIGPDNIESALKLGCAGVDMNSALEEGPGVKSAAKISRVFEIIRAY